MTATARNFIAAHEGCKLKAYLDSGGVCTIGYGATGAGIVPDLVWTQDQADVRLDADIARAINSVRANVGLSLTENQEAALASFVFNLGEKAFKNSTLRQKVIAHDWVAAALEFIKWRFDNKKEVKGLLIRRLEEAALFLK